MGIIWQDLRYGIRMLINNRGFTAVAIVSLALGIGANTAIFSVVNAILLKSLPYKQPDRIVLVWGYYPAQGHFRSQVSATDVADWRSQNNVFEDVATYQSYRPTLSGIGDAERVPGMGVGDGYFKIIGAEPILGRDFTTEEQIDGKDDVIILGYGLWQSKFGSDPNVVGTKVLLNSRPHTIVGVMSASLRSLPTTLIDAPAEFYRPVGENYDEDARSGRHLRAIARLKPGVSIEQAQVEMSVIAGRLEQEHPIHNTGYGVRLVSLPEDTVGSLRPTLLMLLGAVVFVLLIACANVGNLLLARSTARQKEIAIRAALGASRVRLVRQFLTESVLLALAGGALGLLLAVWSTSLIESIGSSVTPLLKGITIDVRVLAFTIAISIVTGIVFGLAPALHLSSVDLNESLKEGSRGSSAGRNPLRSVLVVSEVALALVLLVCAGLMIKSVMRLGDVSPGFNPAKMLTMNVALPGAKYPKGPDRSAFFTRMLDRVGALPGVESAEVTSVLPFSGNFDGRGLAVEDHPKPRGEEISVDLYIASPGYVRAMAIPLIKGRELAGQDTDTTPNVALINQTMAEQLWPSEDPLGKRIKFPGSDKNPQPWRTIVGVVGDVNQYALDRKPPMQMYLPQAQFPTSTMSLVVRTAAEPTGPITAIRDEIRAMDPDQAVFNIATMGSLMSDSISLRRFSMLLLMIFAAVALALAAIGIYGVISFAVTQRTHEIGIRVALGAGSTDILKLVVVRGMILTISGVAIGLVAAAGLTHFLQTLLFSVSATDPATFIVISVLLTGVALVACLVPARRAAKVDPMVALRYE
ncbi:MAG TPA: ABC transporter permease [Blastocatellia bacterium]|nr:ABC transporter permease [Blastocatellia bacterium]